MHDVIAFAIVAFPSLIVIINPVMVTSVFITLTSSATPEAKRAIVRKTTIVSFAVLLVFAIFGTLIFKFLSITIGAFQIAGGIILFSVAMGMLHAKPPRTKQTPEEMREALSRDDVAVVPLAIPMVSGPGSITTVIVLSGEARATPNMAILFLAIVVAMATVYVMLRNAARIQRFLGPSGLNITTRLMGLVLAAIAVQFVIHGVGSVLPELAAAMNAPPHA
ncbi:MAG: MarC family protein [Deltaproteobacteria bacterium]|nr:MarC family protein [Deltaproteobacteria bacterium]